MSTTSMLKAKGLATFANNLSSVPEGSQLVAKNVVIDRDGVIEPRRGIKVWGETYDFPKQLLVFKNQILAHSNDVLEFANGGDPTTFTSFKGKLDFSPSSVDISTDEITINLHQLSENDAVVFSTTGTLPSPLIPGNIYYIQNPTQNTFQLSNVPDGIIIDFTSQGTGTQTINFEYVFDEVEEDLRIKYIELNGNLYVTTLDGIKKITTLTEYAVTNAGGIKALDAELELDLSTVSGFLPNESEVAYRIVWGTRDVNDNLILGKPSFRTVIQNRTGESRNVFVSFTVPYEITTDYFYQIYRTNAGPLDGSGDEMKLVYEAPYTGGTYITVLDEQPEDIRDTGTPLYSNELSGEGQFQVNDPPPMAKDISIYKDTAFYANTKGLHKTEFTLVGLDGLYGNGILTVTGAFPATVTTASAHNYATGQKVLLMGTGALDGKYIITVTGPDTYEIDADSSDYNPTSTDQPLSYGAYITITKNNVVNEYFFVGAQEIFSVSFKDKLSITDSSYFLLNNAGASIKYVFWYDKTGTSLPPTLLPIEGEDRVFVRIDLSETGITRFTTNAVDITTDEITILNHGFVNGQVVTLSSTGTLPSPLLPNASYVIRSATTDTFQLSTSLIDPIIDFTNVGSGDLSIQNDATVSASDIDDITSDVLINTGDFISASGIITTTNSGTTQFPGYPSGQNGQAGFEGLDDISLLSTGQGEDQVNLYVRISTLPSPAAAIEDTAKSLVKVINNNVNEGVVAYYTPTSSELPGTIALESKTRLDVPFQLKATYPQGVAMFNPDLREDLISISEAKPNALYFSKRQQPEAVPSVNNIVIGPKDKQIQRIIGLRDSLFIFKEEGIYRLTGDDFSNFTVSMFDNSATIIAPDTACVLNNQIYCLTTQGVTSVNEAGVAVVSRPIEDVFLKLFSPAYDNFKTKSFAFSYEAERSYIIFVPVDPDDTFAREGFRYNTFTQSWTSWDRDVTCGVVEPSKNLMYLGAADLKAVEIERKTLTSRDYADRQYDRTASFFDGGFLYVDNTTLMEKGDALSQTQYVTKYQLDKLIDKLKTDPVLLFDQNYPKIVKGQDLIVYLTELVDTINNTDNSRIYHTFDSSMDVSLNTITILNHGFVNDDLVRFNLDLPVGLQLNTDYRIINATTDTFQLSLPNSTEIIEIDPGIGLCEVTNEYIFDASNFQQAQVQFNYLIDKLNLSTGVFFTDFEKSIGTITYDLIIDVIQKSQNRITTLNTVPFFLGPFVHYKAIKSNIVWSNMTFNEPSLSKHVREGVVLIENRSLQGATLGYATDLSGNFEDIPFTLDGDGRWGMGTFGSVAWGGYGNQVPMRTLIPRRKQRCRYIKTRFLHSTAFFKFSILGIAYTYEVNSERAWR